MTSLSQSPVTDDEFRLIVASTLDAFLLVDMGGNIIEANNSYSLLTGYSRDDLARMHISDLDTIDSREDVLRRTEDVKRLGSLRFDTRHRRKDGLIVDVEASITYSEVCGGCVFSFFRDISERKRLELEQRASEARYRAMVEKQTEYVNRYLPGGILTYVNEALCRFGQLTREQLIGSSFYPFIHEDVRAATIAAIDSISKENPTVTTEDKVVLPDGSRRWTRWTHTGFFDTAGSLLEYQGVGRDITDSKAADEKLKESLAYLQGLIASMQDGFVVLDTDGVHVEVNDALCAMTGFSREELLGSGLPHLYWPEEEYAAIRAAFQDMPSGVFSEKELILKRKNGERFPAIICPSALKNDNGEVTRYVGTIKDISERKRAETALKESNDFLNKVQNVASIGIYDFDIISGMWSSSPVLDAILGIDTGHPHHLDDWLALIRPDYRDRMHEYLLGLLKVKSWFDMEYPIVRPNDGRERWMYGTGDFSYDKDGNPVRMYGTIQDITKRKESEREQLVLEQQLLQAQKLESLGVLAGGIAHDFNNILAVIIGNCSMAALNPDNALRHIRDIENAGERAAGLCRQMLAYAGKATTSHDPVDLCGLVREMIDLLRASIGRNVDIIFDSPDAAPSIVGDTTQIRQVVMNLITNAAEAVGEAQGAVRVVLSPHTVRQARPEYDYNGKPIPTGSYQCLEVDDNGCGMDRETIQRVFEPFYTTKFSGRGLGMAATLGIVAAHKGAIQLSSQPGQGTTFRVYFPLPPQHADTGSDEPSAEAGQWQRSGTALLAEDEQPLQQLGKMFLERLGLKVITAENGQEALELYRRHAGEMVLIVSDVGMPVMDGYALVSELKRCNAAVPVILVSGYGEADMASKVAGEDIFACISKPYNFATFQKVVKAALESGGVSL